MAKKQTTYRVDYEQDKNGHWTAVIDQSQGVSCVTQGRSLAQARKRIREALAASLDNDGAAEAAELVDNIVLPARVRKVVEKSRSARELAERAAREAQEASVLAARQLTDQGISLRDAAEILGVSFQRVHQIGRAG